MELYDHPHLTEDPTNSSHEEEVLKLHDMVNLPSGYTDLHTYAQDVITFMHEPLSVQITGGIHVNDAFVYDAWSRLPSDWTQWWETLPSPRDAQKDLINSLHKDPEARSADLPGRPQSLSRWLERVRDLSLDRDQMVLPTNIAHIRVPEDMAGRMVSKKLAEVHAGARYIKHICETNNIKRVVDIGSGQGYLSLTLAAVCGLKVLAIDGNAKQIEGSQAAATQAGLTEGNEVTHLVRFVDGGEALASDIQDWAENEACLLTGLHACGSLSEHMVRLFTNVPCITRLAAVGCCYNHIAPLSPKHPDGFPISQYMRDNSLSLSTSALITGCQAPTNWVHNPDSLFGRKHWYRAVLEKLLFDKQLLSTETRLVWGIRNGDLKSFEAYTKRAIQTLGLQMGTGITPEEIRLYEERYKHRTAETAVLWTLSVLLCRVVESVITLDRSFYLLEHEAKDVDVLPIFDYQTSPRNLMVVASK